MAGVLYVVATPIGNLGDLTRRAEQTLTSVQRVVAEDTRRTRSLLSHLGVRGTPITRLDAHSSARAVSRLAELLASGQDVALVTDAGTPGVSDPGAALVRAAAEANIDVVAVPGPSAVTAAVSISGLVEGPFFFCGFLPRRGERRRRALEAIERSEEPIVLFEAPARTEKTLTELAAKMPSRPACVTRELTKVHESALRGTLAEVAARARDVRGEVTVVLGPAPASADPPDPAAVDAEISRHLEGGGAAKAVSAEVAAWAGLSRREVYRRVIELRKRRRSR